MSFFETGSEIRPVFKPDEILALQDEITAHIDRVTAALYTPFETSCPGAAFDKRLELAARKSRSYADLLCQAVCTDAQLSAGIAALTSHRELRTHMESVAGGPIDGATIRIRASIPSVPQRRQGWHSDVAINDGGRCSQLKVTCWIPLTDTSSANGTLEVIGGRFDEPFSHVSNDGQLHIPDEALSGLARTAVECPAGSCVFIDRFTPHRTLPNASDCARWSVVVWARKA